MSYLHGSMIPILYLFFIKCNHEKKNNSLVPLVPKEFLNENFILKERPLIFDVQQDAI